MTASIVAHRRGHVWQDHVSDILRQWEYFLIDQDGDGELTTGDQYSSAHA